jgi:UDP-N-acetylmuramoyl-tripeptide--D-alanyl-D-alanine ligase
MKQFILNTLKRLAQAVIARHKPIVVAITGTVGKSTTAHFLYDSLCILYGADKVGVSKHNYNGEYGVPLTILGCSSPHHNPFLWIGVACKGLYLAYFSREYPQYLVLEYGIDHPGEMDFLLSIAVPDIAVVLAISKNHVANFASYDEYVAEKLKIIPPSKSVIFNGDDSKIRRFLTENPRDWVVSFGRKSVEPLDIRAAEVSSTLEGLIFKVVEWDTEVVVKVPVVGAHQSYNILPVFALAQVLGKPTSEVMGVFEDLVPQKGRGSILQWVNDTTIIDGSYNGSHEAISAGIEYLRELDVDIVRALFLGDMRELGSESRELHEDIASQIIALDPAFVVLVGEEMKKYTLPLLLESLGEARVFHSLNAKIAGQKVRELLYDTEWSKALFVKGSQTTIYLEEGIREFLFDLQDVDNLCRQSPRWIKKKNEFFTMIAPS